MDVEGFEFDFEGTTYYTKANSVQLASLRSDTDDTNQFLVAFGVMVVLLFLLFAIFLLYRHARGDRRRVSPSGSALMLSPAAAAAAAGSGSDDDEMVSTEARRRPLPPQAMPKLTSGSSLPPLAGASPGQLRAPLTSPATLPPLVRPAGAESGCPGRRLPPIEGTSTIPEEDEEETASQILAAEPAVLPQAPEPEEEPEEPAACQVCGRPPEFSCSRCEQAQYCSSECQRADWTKHRAECKKHRRASKQVKFDEQQQQQPAAAADAAEREVFRPRVMQEEFQPRGEAALAGVTTSPHNSTEA